MANAFKKGDKVTFLPGPRSTAKVTAEVVDVVSSKAPGGVMLVTKDGAGFERKVTPGRCVAA